MTDQDVTRELADIQKALIDLPDDAFAERFELRKRQDELRAIARSVDNPLDASRSDEDLLGELRALRDQMKSIEKQRIDLVQPLRGADIGPGARMQFTCHPARIGRGSPQSFPSQSRRNRFAFPSLPPAL